MLNRPGSAMAACNRTRCSSVRDASTLIDSMMTEAFWPCKEHVFVLAVPKGQLQQTFAVPSASVAV
jgi:hypothetical protein